MRYVVGLVENGFATHKWLYDDYPDAIHQLRLLIEAFDEVNVVRPVLLKVPCGVSELSLDHLLKFYSETPKASSDYYEQ